MPAAPPVVPWWAVGATEVLRAPPFLFSGAVRQRNSAEGAPKRIVEAYSIFQSLKDVGDGERSLSDSVLLRSEASQSARPASPAVLQLKRSLDLRVKTAPYRSPDRNGVPHWQDESHGFLACEVFSAVPFRPFGATVTRKTGEPHGLHARSHTLALPTRWEPVRIPNSDDL